MVVVIEIPKGDDRRRHLKFDKTGFIDLGTIKDVIPVNDGVMPVHYGYIPETLNASEGDEIDVLVLSTSQTEVGQAMDVKPIALMRRSDKDDKVVAVDETRGDIQTWEDIPSEERKLIEEFFSFHHKILAIEDTQAAEKYIHEGLEQFHLASINNKK